MHLEIWRRKFRDKGSPPNRNIIKSKEAKTKVKTLLYLTSEKFPTDIHRLIKTIFMHRTQGSYNLHPSTVMSVSDAKSLSLFHLHNLPVAFTQFFKIWTSLCGSGHQKNNIGRFRTVWFTSFCHLFWHKIIFTSDKITSIPSHSLFLPLKLLLWL